jgi:hypothetical protein
MGAQVCDWPDGHKALVDPQHKTEMKQVLLVVVGHVQHNHPLTLSGRRKANGSKKQYCGNDSVDLQ